MKVLGKITLIALASMWFGSAAFAGADVTIEDIAEYDGEKENPLVTNSDLQGNILNVQERLAVIGYYPTYLVNGAMRPEMREAIKRFQKDYGLKADAIFGAETATALNYYTGTQHIMPINHYRTVYYNSLPGYYAN
ncbi:MAG: peptidoglycan-binding domain-containing protein [Rickettsiales bacterium]|nr:peptidoglycan-binding domain-containing protein [Rickettsiales bacterium]